MLNYAIRVSYCYSSCSSSCGSLKIAFTNILDHSILRAAAEEVAVEVVEATSFSHQEQRVATTAAVSMHQQRAAASSSMATSLFSGKSLCPLFINQQKNGERIPNSPPTIFL